MNLDDLLSEAMDDAQARDAAKRAAKAASGRPPTFHDLFANPDNWRRGKVIAVVHRGPAGDTLLGAFVESIHKTGARKLERAERPLAVDRQEFVSGPYWLAPPAETVTQVFADAPEVEDRELCFDVVLEAIQALAYDAMIRVRLDRGWIRSVQLAQATQFACPTNKTHFFLPKRIEVLDAMSFDNKVELKTRLKI